jgi:hypothetical protein
MVQYRIGIAYKSTNGAQVGTARTFSAGSADEAQDIARAEYAARIDIQPDTITTNAAMIPDSDTLSSCPFGGTRKDRAHGECPASCPCYCDGE